MKAATVAEAARLFRAAFPKAKRLLALTKIIGSTNIERIHAAGFDIMPDPSRNLPTHCRLIHPDGVAGFSEENLRKLATAFVDTREQES